LPLASGPPGMALELQPQLRMSWMWRRRKTPLWQQRLDRLLDLVLAVLGTVFLVEVILLLS
jgi:hypothetical protein